MLSFPLSQVLTRQLGSWHPELLGLFSSFVSPRQRPVGQSVHPSAENWTVPDLIIALHPLPLWLFGQPVSGFSIGPPLFPMWSPASPWSKPCAWANPMICGFPNTLWALKPLNTFSCHSIRLECFPPSSSQIPTNFLRVQNKYESLRLCVCVTTHFEALTIFINSRSSVLWKCKTHTGLSVSHTHTTL